MKKIVHVQVLPKMTGVQQISYEILKGLGDDYEKYVIFGSSSGVGGDVDLQIIESLFNKINVTVIYVESMKREISIADFKAFFELYSIFKKYKFDIVHTNSTKPGIIARIAASFARIHKVVHTVHGISFHQSNFFFKRFFYFFIEFISLPFGHYNVTVNAFYLKYYPGFFTKNLCILNGVDFDRLDVNRDVSNKKSFNVGFFARLDQQKDPLTFLKAVKKISSDNNLNKEVAFYLAGDGVLKNECLKYIEEHDLSNVVTVVGWVSDVSSFLNNIDVICQPSRWEAFGLSIVEAGYFGIPCVASSVEGIPEVVLDGVTGFLCDAGSIDSFSEKISILINDDDLFKLMSDNVRQHVVKNFAASRMVSEYIDLYSLDNTD